MINDFQRFGRLDTWIVGIQYYQGSKEAEGREVVFEREPENRFDVNAVAVHTTTGTKVGHLPRYDAEYVSPLILEGVIALKGRAGPSERGDRLPLSLEVYATSRLPALLARDPGDDWRATYHNALADVWSHISDYTSETLRGFRDRFRPLAHDQPLFPKTQFLYRMLKAHIADLEARERGKFQDAILKAVEGVTVGPPMGWPDFTVYPLDSDGEIPSMEIASEPLSARFPGGDPMPILPPLFLERCPYPSGAQGVVVALNGNWHSFDWFDSPQTAQVVWYQTLLSALERPGLNLDQPSGSPLAPERLKFRIVEALEKSDCTRIDMEAEEGYQYIQLLSEDRCGEVLCQKGVIRRVHFGDAERIYHGRSRPRHACSLTVE